MRYEEPNVRLEQATTRAITVFVIVFSAFFIMWQWEGLAGLLTWLMAGLSDLPNAIERIVIYYGSLPAEQLLPSLLLGAGSGAFLTALIFLASRGLVKIPRMTGRAQLIALLIAVVGWLLGGDFFAIALLAYACGLLISFFQKPHMARLWTESLQGITTARGMRIGITGLAFGAGLGLLGSQMLTLPTQHCTFAPEAPYAEYQIGLIMTILGSALVLMPLWTLATQAQQQKDLGTSGYFRSRWLPYLFLGPMLVNLLLFLYYPSLQTVTLSLFSRRFPLPQERFVCMGNYTSLFNDVVYQNSFITTALITVAVVLISMSLSLGIALLASQKVRGISIYRTLLIWPFALSPVVAGAIFLTMFREGQTGLINAVINTLFGVTLNWLRDPNLARLAVILSAVWNIMGFNILFYVAGLQNIAEDLLEAAQIDGANRVQRFVRITFPLLAPFTFFLLVTNVTYSFYGIYGVVDTITSGGPPLGAAGILGGATDVLIYKLYEDAFNPGSPVGMAAAQAVILFLIVAVITILQFRTLESRITYGE